MGILNKKTRFIDLVVTQEGKKQLAAGRLRAEFASLSDANSFYDKNEKDNVSERLYFEVLERPENQIIPGKNDSGRLFYQVDSDLALIENDLFEVTSNPNVFYKAVTGSQFQSVFTGSFSNSLVNHFKNNYFLKSNIRDRENNFEIDKENITFTITNGTPFPGGPVKETINVNDAQPFFLDPHLAYFNSYNFLPPINTDGSPYGNYRDLRSKTKETWSQIKQNLGPDHFKKEENNIANEEINLMNDSSGEFGDGTRLLLDDGKIPLPRPLPIQAETIKFKKSSDANNFILQIYENGISTKLTKLDIIDAGSFIDNEDPNKRYEKRVFYVGKIFNDDLKIPTYINIFTIVMD